MNQALESGQTKNWLYHNIVMLHVGDTDLSIFLKERLSTHSLQVDTVFNGINYYMPLQKQRIP